MLQNAYLFAKIGADTAENEQQLNEKEVAMADVQAEFYKHGLGQEGLDLRRI